MSDVTAHPVDTEALRARLAPLAWHSTPPITTDHARHVLDALDVAEHRATRAEAQIKAVEDVLEESEARGPVGMTFNGTPFPAWISIATVRRALTA